MAEVWSLRVPTLARESQPLPLQLATFAPLGIALCALTSGPCGSYWLAGASYGSVKTTAIKPWTVTFSESPLLINAILPTAASSARVSIRVEALSGAPPGGNHWLPPLVQAYIHGARHDSAAIWGM